MDTCDLNQVPIDSVAANLGREFNGKTCQPCLVCPSSDAMQVNDDNTIHCYSCGFHGGPLKLVAAYYNLDLKTQTRESISQFKKLLNIQIEEKIMNKENNSNKNRALQLWNNSVSINDAPECLEYFNNRNIELAELPKLLRFNQKDNILVLPFFNEENEITGVHRTYLTSSFHNVKDEQSNGKKRSKKLALGQCKGLIMLYRTCHDLETLIIAEGLEKTVALRSILGPANYAMAYSTAIMKGSDTAKQIKTMGFEQVIICADNDSGGQGIEAASMLFFNLRKQNISAKILKPKIIGKDWDDLLSGDEAC